jgi:hypothetical protein
VRKNRSDALLIDCEKEVARYVRPGGGNLRKVVMQRAALIQKGERSQAECGNDEAGPERWEDSQETVPDKSANGIYGFVAARNQETAEDEEAAHGQEAGGWGIEVQPIERIFAEPSQGECVRPDHGCGKEEAQKPNAVAAKV